MRKIEVKILEDYGYKVNEAEDGEDAIDKFKLHKDKIKLAILDVVMPKIKGNKVYEEIKKINPEIKVLFISGYPEDKIASIIEKMQNLF